MRVFISYSRSDQALAHLLAYILTTGGIKCYLDRAIRAGRYFDHEIKEMIRKADVVLVLLTRSSINSAWVNQEIGFAIAHDRRVWPLALEEDLEPTGMISMTESYALLDWSNPAEAIENLLHALRRDAGGEGDLPAVGLDQVLTGRIARGKFIAQKLRELARDTDRKITIYHQAGFSVLGVSDDPLYPVPGVHTPEYVQALKEERAALDALVSSPHTTFRLMVWPVRPYDERHMAPRFCSLLDWLRSKLDDPSVEYACGPFPGPKNRHIVLGEFVLEGYKLEQTPGYEMSVVRYQPGKVREAAQEYEAIWRQLWRGDKRAVVKQVEEMYAKVSSKS
jgi:hypothetical protein